VTYEFYLKTENESVELLPEVMPTAGKKAIFGGDTIAFDAAKSSTPQHIFVKGGLYFQAHLLKALAGFDAETLKNINTVTRKSLITAVEKLFRLPEQAGLGCFYYEPVIVKSEDIKVKTKAKDSVSIRYQTETLSEDGMAVHQYLLTTRQDEQSNELDKAEDRNNQSNELDKATERKRNVRDKFAERKRYRTAISTRTRASSYYKNDKDEDYKDDEDSKEDDEVDLEKGINYKELKRRELYVKENAEKRIDLKTSLDAINELCGMVHKASEEYRQYQEDRKLCLIELRNLGMKRIRSD